MTKIKPEKRRAQRDPKVERLLDAIYSQDLNKILRAYDVPVMSGPRYERALRAFRKFIEEDREMCRTDDIA